MSYRDAPKQAFPQSLKTTYITDSDVVELIQKEKEVVSELERVRTELRSVMSDRDAALRIIDSSRDNVSKGNDEFQNLVDRKRALSSRLDELQLEQSKMSDARNELQLLGFEIKPLEAEIIELHNKIDELGRNETTLTAQRTELLKDCAGVDSVSDADAQIAKIEEQMEAAKKGGQAAVLTSLTRQKTAAEKVKKNVMATYQLDERIIKEGKRQVMVKKSLESKEGQVKALNSHRTSLRDKLDSQKTLDEEYKKIKAEIQDINKKLDTIQAKKKERANAAAEADTPANAARADVAKLQGQQKDLLRERDALTATLTDLCKKVQNNFTREVQYNGQYRRHLIGRNGATMETLMQDFGVALSLDGPMRDSGIALIYGTPEATEACAAAIKDIVVNAEASDKTESITFDTSLTKVIIGTKGATIEKLQSTSGAHIKVDGDKLHINGTQESIDAAKSLINEIFAGNASTELTFDPAAFDVVIGKGGSVIRQIERDSGVKSIRADRDRGILFISGHQDNVGKAVEMYQQILVNANNKVIFNIPAKMASLVIGPQGKTIREIQELSGATINLQTKGNFATVTIRGALPAMQDARRRVEEIALRDEVKIPYDGAMSTFLTTRPVETDANGANVEKMSPLEAIRMQCECDYVAPLRAEGKIVIRGRPEAVTKARALLQQFLQVSAPKSLRLPMPVVLIPHLTKRGPEGVSILDQFRTYHSASILNVELDRNSKTATLIGQPHAPIGVVNGVAQELERIIHSFKYVIVPVPPMRCGAVIGSGGKTITEIQTSTNTTVNVDRDAGEVTIFSPTARDEDLEKAAMMVTAIRDAPRDHRQM